MPYEAHLNRSVSGELGVFKGWTCAVLRRREKDLDEESTPALKNVSLPHSRVITVLDAIRKLRISTK